MPAEKLVEGGKFDARSSGALIDGTYMMVKVYFDNTRLQYIVRTQFNGCTREVFDSQDTAIDRYNQLVDKYDLE